MLIIGLTGGIASGKSTVSGMLKRLGAEVIDADVLAREVVAPGEPAWSEIVATFGEEILNSDGTIHRPALGSKVFGDPTALARLNGITHPRVIERTEELLTAYRQQNPRGVVVIDAPLLLEAGMEVLVDEVWVVSVPEETQVRRVVQRDKLPEAAARRRIRSQMPLAEKIKRAHRVIDTSVSLERTMEQVLDYWKDIMEKLNGNGRENSGIVYGISPEAVE
ncbi:hypothetical protein SY88_06005 [Clostridiales bacterium PH28_bin88]|nr:hypothetical protein SY88_06005 [Clostridiales bacterium PH28_bin88]